MIAMFVRRNSLRYHSVNLIRSTSRCIDEWIIKLQCVAHFNHELIPTYVRMSGYDIAGLQDITVWSGKGIGSRVMPGHQGELQR